MASNRGINGSKGGRSPSELRDPISFVRYEQIPDITEGSVFWESKITPYLNTKAKVTQGRRRWDKLKEADGTVTYIIEVRTPDQPVGTDSLVFWEGMMMKVNATQAGSDPRFLEIVATVLCSYNPVNFTLLEPGEPLPLPEPAADPFYTLPD